MATMRLALFAALLCLSSQAIAQIQYTTKSAWIVFYGPFPAGGQMWVSDAGSLPASNPGMTFRQLTLPSWFPAQALITRFDLSFGAQTADLIPDGTVNYVSWIDPGGMGFQSANGAEAGSDFSHDIGLVHGFANVKFFSEKSEFPNPVAYNRTGGDKLIVEMASSYQLDWIAVNVFFLVPAPFQPQS